MKVIKQSAHIVTDWPRMNLYERCEFAGRISHASENKIKEGSAEEFVRRMVKLGHESVFEFARVMCKETGEWALYPNKKRYFNVRTLREQVRMLMNKEIPNVTIFFLKEIFEKYPIFFSDLSETIEKFFAPLPQKELVYEWGEVDDWIPVVIVTNRAISHQLVRYRKDVVYLQASQRYIKFHDDIDFIGPDVYFDTDDKMYRQWIESMEGAEQDYIHCLSEGYSAQAARLFLPNSAATKLIMYASPDTWRHVFEQRISDKADPMIRELLEPLREEFIKGRLL